LRVSKKAKGSEIGRTCVEIGKMLGNTRRVLEGFGEAGKRGEETLGRKQITNMITLTTGIA